MGLSAKNPIHTKGSEAGRVGPGDTAGSAANRIGFFCVIWWEEAIECTMYTETQYLLLKHYRLFKGTFWEGKGGGGSIRERTQEACSGC